MRWHAHGYPLAVAIAIAVFALTQVRRAPTRANPRPLRSAGVGQSWCQGTYRVSVSVMDLGRAGNLKHPAKPFGTATFTVHP